MTTLPIRITETHGKAEVLVDGHNISNHVYGASIRVASREIPEVELDLLPSAVEFDVDVARIVVDGQTRTILERLGWTPPAGEL